MFTLSLKTSAFEDAQGQNILGDWSLCSLNTTSTWLKKVSSKLHLGRALAESDALDLVPKACDPLVAS